MKLKIVEVDGKQYAEVQNGLPVFTHDDGKEVPFDAAQALGKIRELQGEAKNNRERAEAAEKVVKAFEGVDPAAAKDALDKIKTIDAKKLIDAGEVEKVKAEISKAFEEKLSAADQRAAALESELYGEKIGGAFARSQFAAEKLAIPADFVQARFGQQFKLEEGKVVAYDSNGNKLYSRAKPGELAAFDEALEMLVEQYPQRDHILKGSGHNGSGKQPGTNGGGAGAKTMTRAEFDKLDAGTKGAKIREGFQVVDAA